MLQHVPENVVASIGLVSRQRPDQSAIIDETGGLITYAEVVSCINKISDALASEGVAVGTRIATCFQNGTANSLAMLAVMKSSICCPLPPNATAHEFTQYLLLLNVQTLIHDASLNSELAQASDQLGLLRVLVEADGGALTNVSLMHCGVHCQELAPTPDERSAHQPLAEKPALILLTSGSTGYPKRVLLSHRNLLHSASEVASSLQLSPDDICLSMWEQYHIGGVVDVLLAPLLAGSAICMTTGFSLDNFDEGLRSSEITWFQCVPTTLQELMRHTELSQSQTSFKSLRFIRCVADALSEQAHRQAEARFSVPVVQTYGMTEASPLIATNSLEPEGRRHGSVGKPLGTSIKLCREGVELSKSSQIGEIYIKGVNVIISYDDPSGETSDRFEDGWFKTGDLGYFDDDGFLFLAGRIKAQINRGGEKISPKELEAVAAACPGIVDSLAFPIPHSTLGSVVGLAVVLSAENGCSREALTEILRSKLSAFKLPARIWCVPSLPRTSLGKLRSRELDSLIDKLMNQDPVLDWPDVRREAENCIEVSPYIMKSIVAIWERELDVKEVCPDDDFYALGGDSLSAMRILTAAEQALSITYSLDILPELLDNPRAMAELSETMLRTLFASKNRGIPLDGSNLQDKHVVDDRSIFEFVIATGISGEVNLTELHQDQVLEHLSSIDSLVQFRAAVERLRNLWTPSQSLDFIGAYLANVSAVTSPIQRPEHVSYLRQIREELSHPSFPSPTDSAWVSYDIAPGVRYYMYQGSGKASRHHRSSFGASLIIGCAGFFHRMMMPMDLFLQYLAPARSDFLFLWDQSGSYFEQGIGSYASNAIELKDKIQALLENRNYTRVLGIGVSMGGVPMMAMAMAMGLDHCLVVSPSDIQKNPSFSALIRKSAICPAMIFCGGDNQSDVEAARKLSQAVQSDVGLVKGCSSHNLLWYLHQRGGLSRFLENQLFKVLR